MNIAIVGASGFIGTALTVYMAEHTDHQLVLFSHQASKLQYDSRLEQRITHIDGSVLNQTDITDALHGCDVAIYLVHLMGTAAFKGTFESAESEAATHFANAVVQNGIARVVYVGGMADAASASTPHLQSRDTTASIMRAKVTQLIELKTPMVIGAGGAGFEVIKKIVQLSPLFPVPRWAQGVTRPITVHDVVAYVAAALTLTTTDHLTLTIGGPEQLRYADVAKRYAKHINKRLIVVPLPFVPRTFVAVLLRLLRNNPPAATVADMIGSAGYSTTVPDGQTMQYLPQVTPEPIELAF